MPLKQQNMVVQLHSGNQLAFTINIVTENLQVPLPCEMVNKA